MSELFNQDQETVEDLQFHGLKLIQKKKGFRFGMDAVLLADFARIRPDDSVADFGSGSGILPVLLYGRGKGKTYYAVEIQEELCHLAERNLALNGISGEVICADLRFRVTQLPMGRIDAVIANPPYGEPHATIYSLEEAKAIARSQREGTLDGFFANAFYALKGRGKISVIYPVTSMLSLMNVMKKHHLEPKRFRLIYPNLEKPANLVLVEAVKDAKAGLHAMPPLIVREENGDLTNELKSIYHMA